MTTLDERVAQIVQHAYQNTTAMQQRMDEAGVTPDDVQTAADLAQIPTISKDDMVRLQAENPPFGGMLAIDPGQLKWVFFSPGPLYEGVADDEAAVVETARVLEAIGFEAGDVVLNTMSYHLVPFGILFDSAIRHMTAFLELLEHELYPALERRSTDMPVVPPGAQRSTLNINSLHGGQEELAAGGGFPSACVADSCRVVLDRRYLIEEDPAEVKQEIVRLLERLVQERPGFAYDLSELWTVQPTMTEADAPVVRAIGAAIGEVLGKAPQHVVSPGTYDQKHVYRFGHLDQCIAYGPGILDLAHQPDEWIGIDDMVNAAKVMAAATLSLLAAGR